MLSKYFLILLFITIITITKPQTINYLTCASNADCLHYAYSFCSGNQCQPCSTSADCSHLQTGSQCQSDGFYNYCTVSCTSTSDPGVCAATNSLCLDNSGLMCQYCETASDCAAQYPSGVQCNTLNGMGYCGYCLSATDCSLSTQSCINFRCTECQSDSDCPSNRPKCSSTLKSDTCMCSADTDCPTATPTCTQVDSNSPMTCFLLPSMTILYEQSGKAISLTFNKPMTTKQGLDSIFDVSLIGVDSSYYSYEMVKVNSYTFQITLTVNTDIPSSTLKIDILKPAQLVDSDGLTLQQTAYLVQLPTLSLLSSTQANTAKKVATGAKVLIIFLLSTSLILAILKEKSILLWVLLNLLQSIYYLTYLEIQYPSHIKILLHEFKIGIFKFLPNYFTLIFPSIKDDDSLDSPSPFALNEMDGLWMINIGNILFVWTLLPFIAGSLTLLIKFMPDIPKVKDFLVKFQSYLVWSGIARVFIASFTELSFPSLLQLKALNFDTPAHGLSAIFSLISTIIIFTSPPLFVYLLRKNIESSPALQQRFGKLTNEFQNRDPFAKYFPALALTRKLIVTFAMVFLYDSPLIVILLILTLDIIFVVFSGMKPFKENKYNVLHSTIEVLNIFIHFLVLSLISDEYDGKPQGEIRLWTAWSLVGSLYMALIIMITILTIEIMEIVGAILKKEQLQNDQDLDSEPLKKRHQNQEISLPKSETNHENKVESFVEDLSQVHSTQKFHLDRSLLNMNTSLNNSNIGFGRNRSNIINNSNLDESTFGNLPNNFKPLETRDDSPSPDLRGYYARNRINNPIRTSYQETNMKKVRK